MLVHLAVLALRVDDLTEADRLTSRALAIMERYNLKGVLPTLPVFPVGALVAAKSGRVEESRRHRAAAQEMLDRLDFVSPRSGLYAHLLLGQAAMAIGDWSLARESATEGRRARRLDPSATYLNAELDELLAVLAAENNTSTLVTPLTDAEFRVLRYLPTHLSLQEVADELNISRHTAKSHSVSIYRKLGVSSRSEAVTEALRLGIMPTQAS